MKKAIFLHGFYASGSCPMAVALKDALKGEVEVLTPDLPLHPSDALTFVRELCGQEHPDMLIGNSNGAFIAQMIATELQIPALLGNPHLRMSEFVNARIGENQYKSPRMDGKQDFVIEPSLVDEFAELEAHQWDKWNQSLSNLCVGLFGEKDTLAHFEPAFREHYDNVYHFPGDHTPTEEDVRKWYVPIVKESFKSFIDNNNEY